MAVLKDGNCPSEGACRQAPTEAAGARRLGVDEQESADVRSAKARRDAGMQAVDRLAEQAFRMCAAARPAISAVDPLLH